MISTICLLYIASRDREVLGRPLRGKCHAQVLRARRLESKQKGNANRMSQNKSGGRCFPVIFVRGLIVKPGRSVVCHGCLSLQDSSSQWMSCVFESGMYIYIHIFQMDIFMFKIYGIVMNQTPGISWNYKSLDSLVDTVLSNKSFEK